MAYVPPHLRQRRFNDASSTEGHKQGMLPVTAEDPSARSLKEISEHFWPIDPETRETTKDALRSGTLHDSAATPNRLAYIILFHEANPKWASDGVIFTKTELELLPAQLPNQLSQPRRMSRGQRRVSGAEVESPTSLRKLSNAMSSPSSESSATKPRQLSNTAATSTSVPEEQEVTILSHGPIAVFDQMGFNRNGRSYRFVGWHKVTSITLIEPNTPALARTLEQKWSRNDCFGNPRPVKRDAVRWNESLGYRWAVVKLEKDVETEDERGELVVAKLPDEDVVEGGKTAKKSVNELLAEMRMGGIGS